MNTYIAQINKRPLFSTNISNLLIKILKESFKDVHFVNDTLLFIKTDKRIKPTIVLIETIEYFKDAEILVSKLEEHEIRNLPAKSKKWLSKNYEDDFIKELNINQNITTHENVSENLENLIGLTDIKAYLSKLKHYIKIEKEREKLNLKNTNIALHMVFKGPSGTGKTTVARLLGKIYKDMGYLKKGHVIEVDRTSLVAEYIGHTAQKTLHKLNAALDGILFIDEAYALNNTKSEKDFGTESIETILKFMEDHRNRIVIIAAGYSDKMNQFINSNPGLKSRFNKSILFDNYKDNELYQIFLKFCNEKNMKLEKNLKNLIISFFNSLIIEIGHNFGNGREVRKFFEDLLIEQSVRLNKCKLNTLNINTFTEEDIINCAKNNYNITLTNNFNEQKILKLEQWMN